MPEDDEQQGGLWIDGELYTVDDLTFKERRLMRTTVRELNSDDPDFDMAFVDPINDTIPVFVWIIKRRTNPDYSMDDVLSMKLSDLEAPATDAEDSGGGKGKKPRPTSSTAST
jgi:hypothetical protein